MPTSAGKSLHLFFRVQVLVGGRTGNVATAAGNNKKKSKTISAGNTAGGNNTTTKSNNNNNGGEGYDGGTRTNHAAVAATAGDAKGSTLLATSRTVEKQLERQRKQWPNGHVRQVLRCRPGLIARVIGKNGMYLNPIVVSCGRKADMYVSCAGEPHPSPLWWLGPERDRCMRVRKKYVNPLAMS